MIPTFSIIFPYIVELTYPNNEAVSNGLMLFSCRICATTFVSEPTYPIYVYRVS